MAQNLIETDQAAAAIGPYSQGVAAPPFVFVSGQIGLTTDGEMVSHEFSPQVKQALANMKRILEAGGCGLADVVAVDVFLTHMGNFQEFNEIYAEFFSGHRPARAVVAVDALPKGALVEIKCVASRP